jgi:hypothetical protein
MHDVELQKAALRAHATAIQKHCSGWSMAFTHTHPEFWVYLKPFIEADIVPTGIRLVTDHFALLKGSSMASVDATQQPGFREIFDSCAPGICM